VALLEDVVFRKFYPMTQDDWKKLCFDFTLFVELKGERKLERRCQFKFFENRGSFSSSSFSSSSGKIKNVMML